MMKIKTFSHYSKSKILIFCSRKIIVQQNNKYKKALKNLGEKWVYYIYILSLEILKYFLILRFYYFIFYKYNN